MNNCLRDFQDLVSFYRKPGRQLIAWKYSVCFRPVLIFIASIFCLGAKAQLVVNEFSQGSGGYKEYIELVVAQPRTCTSSTVDLRGWIIDDHNGWFGYMPNSRAAGCLRLANNVNWASVPCGAIIVIYFHNDVNPKLPPDDPTDANGDKVYVLPYKSIYLETNTAEPPSSGVPAANPYAAGTYTAGLNYFLSVVGLADEGDAIILANPANLTVPSFSILYGPGSATPTSLLPTVNMGVDVGAGKYAYLADGQYANASGWAVGTVAGGNETPGAANTAANQTWIQSLRNLPNISTTVNSAAICANAGPATLTAQPSVAGTYTYSWTVPSGVPNPGNVSSFTSSVAGNYTVNISQGSCAATGAGTVTVNPLPAAYAGTSQTVASGSSTTLGTAAVAGNSYAWTSSPAGFTSAISNPVVSPTTTTTYTLKETISATGCNNTNSVVLSMSALLPTCMITGSTAVCAGSANINYNVTTNGTSPAYSWSFISNTSGATIAGSSSSSTIVINPGNTAGTYQLGVTITSLEGVATCAITVTVNKPPVITTNPPSDTVSCQNNSITFLSAASGTPAPAVQWQVSADGGSSWSDIPGATNPFYTLITSPSDDGNKFRAVYTNSCGTAITNVTTLDVGAPINLGNVVPENVTGCENFGSVSFTISANGGNGTVYMNWQYSQDGIIWVDIPGTTTTSSIGNFSTTYTFTPGAFQDGYLFRVKFRNDGCLESFSGPGRLNVLLNPTVVISPNANQTVCNKSGTAQVNFTGSNATAYNWVNNNPSIGLAASGSSPAASPFIPSFVAVNNGTAPISATITVTPVNTSDTAICPGTAKSFTITVNPTPVVSVSNSCIGGGPVTFSITNGLTGGTWSVSGGGTINAGTGVFSPATAGCFTATYTITATGCTDIKSFVVFPSAPVLVAPPNTCSSAFALPAVAAVPGFTAQYSINGGSFSASPAIPTTPGCHTITARYMLTSACGATVAGATGTGTCGAGNTVNVVIFPTAPVITIPANTCSIAFTLPAVSSVPGFTVQYSIDGGTFAASPVIPTTPGCHTVSARYVLTASCGSTAVNAAFGSGSCATSNVVNVVIYPDGPTLIPPANTCASAFTLPSVTPVAGFSIQFSIDGNGFTATPVIPVTPGCHTIEARYVLANSCGSTAAGSSGGGSCASGNTVSVVIFPAAPTIPTLGNTCNTPLADITAVPAVAGFTAEYAVQAPGGTLSAYNSNLSLVNNLLTNTPGCWMIKARYKLSSSCGSTTAGAISGTIACQETTIYATVFPAAPTFTAPANTCNAAFSLPVIAAVPGFTIQYSIDGGTFSTSPAIPTSTGCHTIQARYVSASDCGTTLAGTSGIGPCAVSSLYSVVIFPVAPTIAAPANTCNTSFILPTVPAVPGFTVQYSIDGGGYSTSPGTIIPGCHTITARYVTAAVCGTNPAGTAGSAVCGASNPVSVVIFPTAPILISPANTCNAAFTIPNVSAVPGFTVQYSIDGGTFAASPGIPTIPGCHTVQAQYVLAAACGSTTTGTAGAGSCAASNIVSMVIFPTAPVITAPANTCTASFTLPAVTTVTGFTIQYSIDGSGFNASPAIPATPGCHTIAARYVLTSACGSTAANSAGAGSCGSGNTVSVVIFPAAPALTGLANTCDSKLADITAVPVVAGFIAEYAVQAPGGSLSAYNNNLNQVNNIFSNTTGCWTIKARYKLASTCGTIPADAISTDPLCRETIINAVVFPTAPILTAPTNTCNTAFSLPTVPVEPGFTVQYNIDGTGFVTSPTIPVTPGCHLITARYILTADCGSTTANSAGAGSCGVSNTVSVVIFPTAPVISAPANTCNAAFVLPVIPAVPGFTIQYSIDGGSFAASPAIPTTAGCHTLAARYVLAAACGATTANTSGTSACGVSNSVNVVIFPATPTIAAPANTCNASFTLPVVTAVPGFSVQYSIDGGAFATAPGTTTAGCHTVQARYVLMASCGSTAAGAAGPVACAAGNIVNVVIFPAAPVITATSNTCASAFLLPAVTVVPGFEIEYSIDGGTFSSSPSSTIPGCHTVQARYVLSAACGSTIAGTSGPGSCGISNTISVVIFPTAPVLTPPGNTCAAAFTLPTVASVPGFSIQYSIDGGAFAAAPAIPTTSGCHSVQGRYILTSVCGGTAAGTAGIGSCGPGNIVNVVIFPTAPTAPLVTPGCGPFTVTPPATIAGFNIEYSFDNGVTWGLNTAPTADNCAGYKIKTRYVTNADCGGTPAGTASMIVACKVGSSRVDLQACKLEYSIVSPK